MRRREEPLVAEPAVGDAVKPRIDEREMLYVLLQEVQTLPERYQTPLVMRYFEGLSRRAIAEQTDSTVAQVQGRLARGRRMLRSRFLRRGVSLSLAAGAIGDTAASAKAAITPTRVANTAEKCAAFKNGSSTASGLSPVALALAQEGLKAMWITFVTKCTAVATATLVAAGIVFAAQQGGQGGDSDRKAAAKKGGELQVTAANAEGGPRTESAEATHANKLSVNSFTKSPRTKLDTRIDALWRDLAHQSNTKAELAAEIEMAQLDKAELQKKAEHLQGWLAELGTPGVDSSGKDLPQEQKEKKVELYKTIAKQLEAVKKDLKDRIQNISVYSAELERTQMRLAQQQREIDELSRIRLQRDIAEELAAATQPAVTGASATKPAGEYRLQPFDAVLIRTKGTPKDEPVNDAYYIEEMGTVALGPTYGRVKVAGLTVLEAEDAIKRKLSEVVDPATLAVQASIASRQGPQNASVLPAYQGMFVPQETDMLQEAMKKEMAALQNRMHALELENTNLKSQFTRRQNPSTETSGPTRIVRQGDQVAIVRYDKKSGKESVELVVVGKDNILTEVAGMKRRDAEDKIRESMERTHPGEGIEVNVLERLGERQQ